MAINDNEFLEESLGFQEEDGLPPETAASHTGVEYGDDAGGRKTLNAILIAIGVGALVAVIIVLILANLGGKPKKRQRGDIDPNQAPIEIKDVAPEPMEEVRLMPPPPPPLPLPPAGAAPDIAPLPGDGDGRRPARRLGPPPPDKAAENLPKRKGAPKPAAQRPEPALVERPSGIRGEVEVMRAPAPAKPSPAPKAAKATPKASGGAWQVQLYAAADKKVAEAQWTTLAKKYPALLGARDHIVAEAAVSGAKVYRLRVVGFANDKEAQAFCARLKDAGADCFAAK